MSEAPERIWAWRNDCGDVWTGEWSDEQDGYTPSDASQYIRADIAERDLAEARAEIERWAEQALKEEDCRKMWQAERDRLAAEVERLKAEVKRLYRPAHFID